MRLEEVAKRKDEQIKHLDERYSVIVTLFMNQITKREIDIFSADFDLKMDEILQEIVLSKYFNSRFPNDNLTNVRNAVLRKVNAERQNNVKSRDDE